MARTQIPATAKGQLVASTLDIAFQSTRAFDDAQVLATKTGELIRLVEAIDHDREYDMQAEELRSHFGFFLDQAVEKARAARAAILARDRIDAHREP